jgi:hypothetical protein
MLGVKILTYGFWRDKHSVHNISRKVEKISIKSKIKVNFFSKEAK